MRKLAETFGVLILSVLLVFETAFADEFSKIVDLQKGKLKLNVSNIESGALLNLKVTLVALGQRGSEKELTVLGEQKIETDSQGDFDLNLGNYNFGINDTQESRDKFELKYQKVTLRIELAEKSFLSDPRVTEQLVLYGTGSSKDAVRLKVKESSLKVGQKAK